MELKELKSFLDDKVEVYNTPAFIENDPISIPHQFTLKEDIEIIGLLVATIAWGNRKSIIRSGNRLVNILGQSPFDFIMEYDNITSGVETFKHRTLNGFDLHFLLTRLNHIYHHGGLETAFSKGLTTDSIGTKDGIMHFRNQIFKEEDKRHRTQKHVANPNKGSASKRINMYLRWMVRKDNKGVDFGLWDSISASQLSCPLDVHSGNIARMLGLLKRKQNDLKAVEELDENLRNMDVNDPSKYDFALFGLGVNEDF